jgi:uroporphyrinogen-III synthase
MRLLVTRPDPQGEQTVSLLRARGHDVTAAPLLRIEMLSPDFGEGQWAAIAVTSTNAIRAIVAHGRFAEISTLPVFAVGRRTAQVANDAGFANVMSADGDADDLIALIAQTLPSGNGLLYLAGEDRASDLAAALAPRDISVQTAEIYRAVAETGLPDKARDKLRAGTIDGVLHFSQRSAQSFVVAARGGDGWDNSLKCHHFCLSMQVAEPLVEAGARHIHVAATPDESAVLDLVGRA